MRNLKLIIVMMMGLALIGCAKDKGSNSTPTNTTNIQPGDANFPGYYIPPSSGPGQLPGDNFEYGGTAQLNNVSTSMLAFYTKNTNLAYAIDKSSIKININLQEMDATRQSYGGVVSIEFRANGRLYRDTFTSLINSNHWYGDGLVTTNKENNKYNVWLSDSEYHGFFQDAYGSIVLVIDDVLDLGDGSDVTVSGSVYVMNFPSGYAPLSPTSCWFVKAGPYDCRTWKTSSGVNTYERLLPKVENSDGGTYWAPKSEGYYKLGTFNNLDATKAFN